MAFGGGADFTMNIARLSFFIADFDLLSFRFSFRPKTIELSAPSTTLSRLIPPEPRLRDDEVSPASFERAYSSARNFTHAVDFGAEILLNYLQTRL